MSDWRRAIYGAILLDFLRDPVRKLDPTQSIWITVSVVGLWGVITLGMLSSSWPNIAAFLRENPKVRQVISLVALALIPGAVMSMLLYQEGYKLVILGSISYLAPFAGITLGACFPKSTKDIDSFLKFYVLVNAAALSGAIAEYLNYEVPALGGLQGVNWVRYNGTETVELIAGFYRGPDIMGLHAAHVAIFSLILAVRSREKAVVWVVIAMFGVLCLFLAGRRKMLGIPLIFVGATFLLAYVRGQQQFRQFMAPLGISVIIGAAAVILTSSAGPISSEYTDYASTLFTQGAARSNQILVGSVLGTLQQSGVLGRGLGSTTQGNRHITSEQGGWQEDGVSRLFSELGVLGVIVVLFAASTMLGAIRRSVQRSGKGGRAAFLQLMLLAVVVANGASFIISHQQYSGDPASALLVLFVLGMALACPRLSGETDRSRFQPGGVYGMSGRV